MFALVLVGVLATHKTGGSRGSSLTADLAGSPTDQDASGARLEADPTRPLASQALAGLGAGPLGGASADGADGADGPSEMVLAKEPSDPRDRRSRGPIDSPERARRKSPNEEDDEIHTIQRAAGAGSVGG